MAAQVESPVRGAKKRKLPRTSGAVPQGLLPGPEPEPGRLKMLNLNDFSVAFHRYDIISYFYEIFDHFFVFLGV